TEIKHHEFDRFSSQRTSSRNCPVVFRTQGPRALCRWASCSNASGRISLHRIRLGSSSLRGICQSQGSREQNREGISAWRGGEVHEETANSSDSHRSSKELDLFSNGH